MYKKVCRYLVFIVVMIVCAIFCLALIGEVAQAAGLVDDTVREGNLYSKYPLLNYQLDFYVDNSWAWLPWNWKDGIGKSVMYGIYCITNFIWIVNLYISNATGYVVMQAYELDFINDMADMIGKNMQILAGVNENGFQSSGFYVGFLLLIILILGIYVTYVGLLKRETSKAVSACMNFLVIFMLSAAFIANAPAYIKKINEFSSDISVAALNLGAKIVVPGNGDEGKSSVELIRDNLFSIQVRQPWLLLQFGDTDESEIGEERIEELLSTAPDKNDGEDRENIVKKEIEDNGNSNLTVAGIIGRLGIAAFVGIFNIGISVFVFLLAGMMIFSQILFVAYAMLLPVGLIFALIPTYNGNVKKIIEKLFNIILTRAGITLIVTITFCISTMFYSMTEEYPFFMIAFMQIITFAGIYYKLNDLMGLFGLNSNDTQQVGRRITRAPYMFLRRNARRMERKVGRSIEKSLTPRKRRTSTDRFNTKGSRQNQSDIGSTRKNYSNQERTRQNMEHSQNVQNRSENEKENIINSSNRSSEPRPNVKNMGERIGNKIGAVVDAKSNIVDHAKQIKEKVKDLPVHSAHKVHEQKAKVRENVAGVKRGIADERLKRQESRDSRQEEYRQNVTSKREELKNNKERKDNKRNNVQREYKGLDRITFAQERRNNEKHTNRGERNR